MPGTAGSGFTGRKCKCGHRVVDHRQHFHAANGLSRCSVPDCPCQKFSVAALKKKPKARIDAMKRKKLSGMKALLWGRDLKSRIEDIKRDEGRGVLLSLWEAECIACCLIEASEMLDKRK